MCNNYSFSTATVVTRMRLVVTLYLQSRVKQNCHAVQWEQVEVGRSNLRLVVNQSVSLDIDSLSGLTARIFLSP